MEEITFLSGIRIEFKDVHERGNFSKSIMQVTQYFKKGKAIYITLSERELAHLFKKMQELGIK